MIAHVMVRDNNGNDRDAGWMGLPVPPWELPCELEAKGVAGQEARRAWVSEMRGVPLEEDLSRAFGKEAPLRDANSLAKLIDGLDLMAAKTPDEVFQLGAAHIERMEREPGRLMTGPRMRGLDEAIAIAEEYLGLGGAVENPSLAETCQRVAGQGDGGGELGTKARADDPQR